jgi:hypothetical protein
MKYKSIKEMIPQEVWEKIQDEMAVTFEKASERLAGLITEEK